MTTPVFTTKNSSLWVFPDGPNNEGHYIGCTEGADISEPLGDISLTRCFSIHGGWKTVGKKRAMPAPITASLTSLVYSTRNYLERIKDKYGLIYLQNDGGRLDSFTNWTRALILQNVRNTSKSFIGVLKREVEDDTQRGFEVSAIPPLIEVVPVTGQVCGMNAVEPKDFTDVSMERFQVGINPFRYGVAVCTSAAGPAKGHVYTTIDGGHNWTRTAGDPFAAGKSINSCLILEERDNQSLYPRLLVVELPPIGAQGHVAYSDDYGATWVVVNLGGAAAGQGTTCRHCLTGLDSHHIWLAGQTGYLYYSEDGGETWTAQASGALTIDNFTSISFHPDGMHGYALTTAGEVLMTTDGGDSWINTNWQPIDTAPTLTYGAAVYVNNDTVWVASEGGLLYTDNEGSTPWILATDADVYDVAFANEYVGFVYSAANFLHRTIDGGYSWKKVYVPSVGANSMAIGDANFAILVGVTGSMSYIEED